MLNRRVVAMAATAAAAGGWLPMAGAQTFPAKPIRVVQPYPAGGTVDVFMRILGPVLERRWGHPVVDEYRPGGGTVIGTAMVAKAAPDGYTLLVLANSLVITAKLHKSLPYDPMKAFAPVAVILDSPQLLAVGSASPHSTFEAWVGAERARPGTQSLGSVGPATTQHIGCELLKRAAGIRPVYVPYAGGIAAVTAMLGGHLDAMVGNYAEMMPHLKAGKLRALATLGRQRLEQLPQVPTVAESGFPDVDIAVWFGLAAPAGTAQEIVARLAEDFRAALNDPPTQQRLLQVGLVPAFQGPTATADHIAQKYTQFARIIDDAGIRME